MSIDIKQINDWLEKNTELNATYSDQVSNSELSNSELSNSEQVSNDRNKLIKIAKNFKKLVFDERWNAKLLTDKFVLFGINNKKHEKNLTLEMALFNAGQRKVKLKKKIIKYINDLTQWEFLQFLDEYKTEKSSGNFNGKWDPYSIKNKREFIREFRSPHFTLENDNIMINLISKIMGIDFIIFHQNHCIQDLSNEKQNDKLIILYKFNDDENNVYICCVGLVLKQKTLTVFNRERLPEQLRIILNRDEFIFEHIRRIITEVIEKEILTLNYIINQLESRLSSKFSHNELREIVKIINSILQNIEYFECA